VGTWGIGVWQDDVAADVLTTFEDLRDEGYSATRAIRTIVKDPPWGWDDAEDSAVQMLAIVTLALQQGVLDAKLQQRGLDVIDSQLALSSDENVPQDQANARKQLLLRLKALIIAGEVSPEDLKSVTAP
jgi:hypothetical protein